MSTMFEVNGKQISHRDLNIVRDFFTDEQWDLIDYALSEYQDHDEEFLKEVFDDEEILWSTQKRLNELFKQGGFENE